MNKHPGSYASGMSDGLFQFYQIFRHFTAADQESAGCKQTCDAENTDEQCDRVVVIHNDMTGGGHDQHLQRVAGGHIDQHTHKFQTDHNGQNVVQEVGQIVKIGIYGDHLIDFQTQEDQQDNDGQRCDQKLQNV